MKVDLAIMLLLSKYQKQLMEVNSGDDEADVTV